MRTGLRVAARSVRGAAGLLLTTLLLGAAAPFTAPDDPPVADAAMRSDLETARELIRQGADVNAAQGDGMTALHWAARNGDVEMAEILIRAGARISPVTRIGHYTPLHLASESGHGSVVRLLLESGGDPEVRTASGGATSLHLAARAGSVEAVAALLEHGAHADVRESARDQTPLMFAAERNQPDAIRILLERGADPSARSRVIHAPTRSHADQAARQIRDRILEGLRQEVPEEERISWRPSPAQVRLAMRTAQRIQEQEERGQWRPEGSDGDDEEPQYSRGWADRIGSFGGFTALHYAAREGHVESVLALLESGADVNEVSGGDQTSPLLIATINGHFDLALLLLERGADPTLASDAGATPLYTTINVRWAPRVIHPQPHAWLDQSVSHVDVVTALLEAGADPNVRLTKDLWYMQFNRSDLQVDTRGATPFWRAAHALDLDVMRLLVAHGADPHVPTMRPPGQRRGYGGDDEDDGDPSGLPPVPEGGPGIHPIHAASGFGHGQGFAANVHRHMPDAWLPTVRYLVEELGADVNSRDYEGYSPVHHAAARGDDELIEYLVEKGADVTVVSRAGQTTVDMANGPYERIQPFPSTIRLLEHLGAKNNRNCLSC